LLNFFFIQFVLFAVSCAIESKVFEDPTETKTLN